MSENMKKDAVYAAKNSAVKRTICPRRN